MWDASWTWDNHHRERFVFGYKIHIAIDSLSGLPIMLTVTKAGYGESSRTVGWFAGMMLLKLGVVGVKRFLADAGYDDGYVPRFLIIRKLKAIPLIMFNPRNCKGNTHEEKKMARSL